MAPLPPTARLSGRVRPWWQRLPLLAHSLAWLLGVALGARWAVSWPYALGAGLTLLALRAALARRPALAWLSLAAVSLLGVARYRAALPDWSAPDAVAAYRDTGREVVLVGVLSAPPERRGDRAVLRVRAERLRFADETGHFPVHGLVLARAPWAEARGLRYGDRVVLRGDLRSPPQGRAFSYRDYLARQGIYAVLKARRVGMLARGQGNPFLAALFALRRRALLEVARLWPQPEAGLLAGILLGDDSRIPEGLYQAFRDTGTAHIIAISGFNITLIAGVLMTWLGRWWGPLWGSLAAVSGIGVYTVFVGADAAVVRAALMGSLAVLARRTARPNHPYTALLFAAALMALLRPTVLWDVGFQLSFGATWGLMRYAEPITRGASVLLRPLLGPNLTRRILPTLSDALLLTLAAQLTTLPITAWHFHRLSLVALVSNPLILLAQAPLMLSGGIALLLALLWEPAGRLAAWLAWPWVAYTIRAVQVFGNLPWRTVTLAPFGWPHVLGYYLLLWGLPHLWTQRKRATPGVWVPTLKRMPLLLGATLLATLLAHEALAAPDRRLHLWLLDTRGGETLLLRTPSGKVVLINGGGDALALQQALGQRLPLLRTTLDALLVASADPDNLRGLDEATQRYRPAVVVVPWTPGPARVAGQVARWREAGVRVQTLPVGGQVRLDAGITLRIQEVQPQGVVLTLGYGDFRGVFPFVPWGGAAARRLPPAPAVFLLAGHGRAGWNDPAWLQRQRPRVLLLAVDPAAQQGLPNLALLQALQGWPLLRTDLEGTMHLITDGRRLWVAAER